MRSLSAGLSRMSLLVGLCAGAGVSVSACAEDPEREGTAATFQASASAGLASGEGSEGSEESEGSGDSETSEGTSDSATGTSGASASAGTSGSGEPTTTTEPTTAGGSSTGGSSGSGDVLPPAIACSFQSLTYGSGLFELDVDKGSKETLSFLIPGLPAPELVTEATLHFRGYDIDHPGEEGDVHMNGGAAIPLPANAGWDNQEHALQLDILGETVAGDNSAVFTAGTFSGGTFYRIGDVRIEAMAQVEECPEPPESMGEEVILDYHQAVFTKRHNWVDRCDFNGGYAYTAKSDEHIPADCEGLYAPDGTRQGKAIFTFEDLAPATYEIGVRSRHTENRNPKGALVIVDGESKRIKQNDDKDFVEDIWGAKALSGTIEVIIDSTQEDASDSVIHVRVTPI